MKADTIIPRRILRLPEVLAITGLSPATIWRRERDGTFPRRVRVSPGRVGWFAHEVEAYLAGLPRAHDASHTPRVTP